MAKRLQRGRHSVTQHHHCPRTTPFEGWRCLLLYFGVCRLLAHGEVFVVCTMLGTRQTSPSPSCEFTIGGLPCATHGKYFAVCPRHTTKYRIPIVAISTRTPGGTGPHLPGVASKCTVAQCIFGKCCFENILARIDSFRTRCSHTKMFLHCTVLLANYENDFFLWNIVQSKILTHVCTLTPYECTQATLPLQAHPRD